MPNNHRLSHQVLGKPTNWERVDLFMLVCSMAMMTLYFLQPVYTLLVLFYSGFVDETEVLFMSVFGDYSLHSEQNLCNHFSRSDIVHLFLLYLIKQDFFLIIENLGDKWIKIWLNYLTVSQLSSNEISSLWVQIGTLRLFKLSVITL